MKQLFLLFILFVTLSQLSAQIADFAPVGAKWYYKQYSSNYPYPEEFSVVEVTDEEVFQGRLCRKMEGLTSGCGLPATSYVFTRNDSVFFWSAKLEQFELLYNFRAAVGSSWLIKGLAIAGDAGICRFFEPTDRRRGHAESLAYPSFRLL